MAATRVSLKGEIQKVKAVIDNDEPVQPPVKKSQGFVNAEDYPKHLSKSDGFLLTRMIAAQQGIDGIDASNEIEGCKLFKKALAETGMLPGVMETKSFMVPISMDLLPEATMNHADARVMKSMWLAGAENQDPEETAWLARRIRKSQSAYIDNIGGTLVAPPVQGELIELMRPKQALINAGCTTVPLPPQGKISYPRQTSPSTMYWIGENTQITESQIGTGQISLQAKKGGVYLTVPNELLKYASVSADALIRKDAAQTLALGFDNAALYGIGGANVPRGLSLYTGTNQVIQYESQTPAPKGINTNGNTLRPEDAYRMIGLIESRNFDFKGWVTTPGLANNINGYRADATTPGDAAGQFVQGVMRQISDKLPGTNIAGYPVSKSNVVTATQSKGNASNLTQLWGGAWEHLLLGMYGAVEFATSNQAGSTFQNDQTAVRALIHCDSVPRYEGAFVVYNYLVNSTN